MTKTVQSYLAFVALDSSTLPKGADIVSEFANRCCDAPSIVVSDEKDGTIMFDVGAFKIFVSLMPAPIPWSDLEGPCETAWWWPEATLRMQSHTHHAIVGMIGDSDNIVQNHIWLSNLVSAVAVLANAIGIYWGPGTVVHEPSSFAKTAAGLQPNDIDPHLWIDMRLEQNDDSSYRYFTTGMEAFDRREIEIDRSERDPKEILEFCYAIINYVLVSGVSIADGETIGRTDDERIRVSYKPSMWKRDGKVMKLSL